VTPIETVLEPPTADLAERTLLGALLIDGSLLARVNGLRPDDFGSEAHRLIYTAMCGLGSGIDLTTVSHELEKTSRLDLAGGAAYVSSLVDRVPDVEHVESYARAVRDAARGRRLLIGLNAQGRALADGARVDDVVANLGRSVAAATPGPETGAQPDSRRFITTAMLFDEFLARKTTIVPCALAGLAKLLHGGFETGKNTVVTAPAGGGKTGFLMQNTAHAVLHGDFFAVVALKDGDQWGDGLRLAQMAGVDRFALRDRVPEAVEAARGAMARYADRLMVYDVSKPGATFLDMAERALRWVNGRGHLILGTDSIHVFTIADQAKERAMSIYDRMSVRFEAVHDFVVANDVAGLTVGQSGRASYSRKREEENVDLLAAISGGHIAENTIDVLIVITKPNEDGTRFLVVPKSRLGGQGLRVPARYDEERSLWCDVEPVTEEAAPKESKSKANQAAKSETDRKAKEGVGLLLRQAPAGLTAAEVRQATGRRTEWVATALDEFYAAGSIRRGTRPGLDSRGRKINPGVWIWAA
jgi:KaiC/GvpD/RAD55 family RecA-like ATPase